MPRSVGEHAGLRLDFLGGEDAPDRSEQRIPVEQLQVPGELLHPVDLAAALDLHGDAGAGGVLAHQVDRPDRRGVLAPDQPPAVAEHVHLRREQFLEMRFDPVLDQAGVDPQVGRVSLRTSSSGQPGSRPTSR